MDGQPGTALKNDRFFCLVASFFVLSVKAKRAMGNLIKSFGNKKKKVAFSKIGGMKFPYSVEFSFVSLLRKSN